MHLGQICSGSELEEALFGCSSKSRNRHLPKSTLDHSLKHVKSHQHVYGWNPRKPRTRAAKAMHTRVAKNLPHGRKELRLFVAIGSTLDAYYGVDAFFEYGGVIVTIDVTVSRHKDCPKADFIVSLYDFTTNRIYQKLDLVAACLLERAQTKRVK